MAENEEKQGENAKESVKDEILKKARDSVEKPEEFIKKAEQESKEIEEIQAAEETKKTDENREPDVSQQIQPPLNFLEDDENVFIGRKKDVFKRFGNQAGLHLGKVSEQGFDEKNVFLDGLNPHVVFVCGARGSGKSYIMGIVAEELALKNDNVGTIVIDPVGVFWSMRYPNKEERELKALAEWNLEPKGLNNLMVFIPKGIEKQTPKGTYDATFSIQPGMLDSQDWCLTFGIDRFSPTGLLLEKSLEKVKKGFKIKDGKTVKGKGKDFALNDIIFCLEKDEELNSRDRGYKADSIRALVSRFEAAKAWGVFDQKGTPLTELSAEGQLTIIDTSFLDENVTSLVVGILARRILAARKITTRQEAAERLETQKKEDLLETGIPATWLFIDEAHTLIPSGNQATPATNSLVEYVKQGRRPGCSLVFATQQPSAIDSKVLSQLDTIMSFKLVFNDDIKAVLKRTPTIIPRKYKASNFIKMLSIGTCLTGDRQEETSRAFIMKVRPRMSQHEGREAETIAKNLPPEKALFFAVEFVWRKLKREKELTFDAAEKELQKLNKKNNARTTFEELLKGLEEKETEINNEEKIISLTEEEHLVEEGIEEKDVEQVEEQTETFEEPVTLLAFSDRIGEEKAAQLANNLRKKKTLGFLGEEEEFEEIILKHLPVYKIKFNYKEKNENAFRQGQTFINSQTGEFLHFKTNQFIESKGLKQLYELEEKELRVLNSLMGKNKSLNDIAKLSGFAQDKTMKILKTLENREIISTKKQNQLLLYEAKNLHIPANPFHNLMNSLSELPVSESDVLIKLAEKISKNQAKEIMQKLWKNLDVTTTEEIYWPVYEAKFRQKNGKERTILIDAVTGKKLGL